MKYPAPAREPRETLTLEHVEKAILHLIEDGKSPNETNVRGILGGSPNTLHPLVRRWFAERAAALLGGRISVVQSSDLPDAVHSLIAELREDARKTAEKALEQAKQEVSETEKRAEVALAASKVREAAALAKENELAEQFAHLRADAALARADAAAARSAADAAAAERREAIAAREVAEAMVKDAQKSEQRIEEELGACEDALAASRLELDKAKADMGDLRGQIAARETELAKNAADAAASMTALRESIEEIKTAHLREVQGLRSTQADAASRWAEAKAALEKRLLALEADLERRIAAATEADLALRNFQHSEGLLKAEIATLDRELEESRRRNAELEKLAARVPEGIADLAERLQRLESESARKAAKEQSQC